MGDAILTTEVVDAVKAAVAARRDDLVDLAETLIRVDSTNASYPEASAAPGGEGRAGDALGERCAQIGMRVERVGPDPGRQNVIAVAEGGGGGRSLLLNGHMDTVPPADPSAWTIADPRRPERHDGVLVGLGAADMKGPLAAGWAALAGLRDAGVDLAGEVQLHGVVGEEAMEHELGTTAVLEAGFVADAAINLEPTRSALTAASPGYRSFAVRVEGRSTHHANRWLTQRPGGEAVGVNALEKAILVVQALQDLERAWAAEPLHPWFPEGSFTLHPGTFSSVGAPGQPAPVFFPAEALLEYGLWYPPGWTGRDVETRVEAFVAERCAADAWLARHPPVFSWGYDWPPFQTPWSEPIVGVVGGAIEAVTGTAVPAPSPASPAAVGASVDSTWIERAGIPVVTFGPGDMAVAHSPDENVAVDDLVSAAQVLAVTIAAWCGAP
ncbi:M20 family metallopeptidase [Capillimicrobium parvum]|uniref:N-formyl-4-amino-5-aminomethyl-2-methylpyrimidine deformylase n=1 Tax=Capillimicrobium parvum TaxID=2884022 RepID=A0A9E6XS72_9ACTN|nr:M20/M25/M40 family metallo-hydrolase [Capillimicrobium parvum]UGS33827.1 N-formyl-4-amino-5-aminomethyl-2-methylpyrimidine deformylase [Capillimicrobium parvum]